MDRAVVREARSSEKGSKAPDATIGGGTALLQSQALLTETFIPGFLERDEGERERPYVKYPWDGISGVRPFRVLAASTTVGVY